jgi:PAS domain S-box-containing protein
MQMSASGTKQQTAGRSRLRTVALSYAFAAAMVAAAFVAREAIDPIWGRRLPFGVFFLAFLVVAHFTEVGPSLFTAVAGFVLADWFFVSPRHGLRISDPVDYLNAVFYVALCLMFSWFAHRMRRALRREQEARAAVGQLAAIIESSDDAIVGNTLDGRIVSWNTGARKLYGYAETETIGQAIDLLLPRGSGEDFRELLQRVGRGERISHFETVRRRKSGALVEVSLGLSPVRNGRGEIIGASTIARDISDWKRAQRERESLVGELQAALAEVKTLSGLLPICSHCKKIRDDKGYWNQIEHYVHEHSNASFTHGICPDCVDFLYPDLKKPECARP